MTDLLDAPAPDSIFSETDPTTEIPTIGGAEPDPHSCPECGEKFDGATWGIKRGVHRRQKHGVTGHTNPAERARQRSGGTSREQAPTPKKRFLETTPGNARKGARANLSELGETLAEFAAFAATARGLVPLGRSITLVSGAAGEALEDGVKGTFVDRLIQPLARMGDRGKEIVGVLGLPFATQAYCSTPNPVTEKTFIGALTASLPAIVKDLKKKKKAQERMEADLSEAAELFGFEPGTRISIEDVARWILVAPVDENAGEPPAPPE